MSLRFTRQIAYDFAALHLYRFKGKGKSDRFVMFVTVIQPGP